MPGRAGRPRRRAFLDGYAVDRRGIAYSVFQDGRLFRVDTASAACLGTTFLPGQNGFQTFGMGYVANTGDAGETLYVAEGNGHFRTIRQAGPELFFGPRRHRPSLSYTLNFVGNFNPPIPGPELTGTADGRLFAFYTNAAGTGSHIIEVDKTSGSILADHPLNVGTPQRRVRLRVLGRRVLGLHRLDHHDDGHPLRSGHAGRVDRDDVPGPHRRRRRLDLRPAVSAH